jgi:predicted ATP-dependent serine protease
LGGEIRGVPQANLRIREAEQMGFTRIVLPAANVDGDLEPAHSGTGELPRAELIAVRHVGEALDALLS